MTLGLSIFGTVILTLWRVCVPFWTSQHRADIVERTKSLFSEQESIGKNSGVKQQMQQVTESRKRKFTAATLLKQEGKVAELATVKQDQRSLS